MAKSLFDMVGMEDIADESSIKIDKEVVRDIAIIGIGLKLPMGDTVEEYWMNLANGVNLIRDIPNNRRLDIDDYLRFCNKGKYQYEKAGYLESIDKFDYNFFNLSPKEASLMDPNQRLFLESAWQAIEDAGYGGGKISGTKTSVYLGYTNEAEYKKMILDVDPSLYSLAVPGNIPSIIASRIAYLLDLQGASMVVDTACSSSLIALHLACKALRNGECSMALAGGVQVHVLPLRYTKLGIESTDNITKTFSNRADGTGGGEGVVAFLLKPLEEAVKDRDHIHAVIKGSASNQDGASMSLSAPNPAAQEKVILEAWKDAKINPKTISYIEAHGTGTKLGDPIEIEGIQRAFQRYTDKSQFCGVGSVKSNMGHLDASSGAAGLLKAVLALENRQIPPSLNFNQPNPAITFADSPVYVNTKLTDWKSNGTPRHCGVSSFSFCGTNCHMVLEEAPAIVEDKSNEENVWHVLTLSAKKQSGIPRLADSYLGADLEHRNLDDMCYTANTGRGHYNYRTAILFDSVEHLKEKLQLIIDNVVGSHIDNDIFYDYNKLADSERGQIQARLYEMVTHKVQDALSRKDALREISELYVAGMNVDWNLLYRNEKRRKISLPVYPFEPNRCWIDIPESKDFDEEYYHTLTWVKRELPSNSNSQNSPILVIGSEYEKGKAICEELENHGNCVIEVNYGLQYEMVDDTHYVIADQTDDYTKLVDMIKDKKISKVVYLTTLEYSHEMHSMDELNLFLEDKVFQVFHLIQSLVKDKSLQDIEFIMVTRCFDKVSGEEEYLYPEQAMLHGFGKVINVENYSVKSRVIDIDNQTSTEKIIDEIYADNTDYDVAYRNNERYIQEVSKLKLQNAMAEPMIYREDGVYLITGGSGGLGLLTAKYLASKGCKTIALVSRTKLPHREAWNEELENGFHPKIKKVIRNIQQMEKNGVKIIYESADVSDESQIGLVINRLVKEYGTINGIVHCAGIGVGKQGVKLEQDTISQFKEVIQPKVQGTWLLNELTKDLKMDFFVAYTSPITITGGVGSGSYTSGNAYLDSFTSYRNRLGKKTFGMSWAPWKNTIQAEEFGMKKSNHLFQALTSEEIIKSFEEILHHKNPYVIVGKMNYKSELANIMDMLPFRLSNSIMEKMEHGEKSADVRTSSIRTHEVELTGRDSGNYTELEKKVTYVWGNILGYETLLIESNFYELGGDSIIAMKVMNQINEIYKINAKVTDLLRNSVLESFCKQLDEQYIHTNQEHQEQEIKAAEKEKFYPISMAQKRILALTNMKNSDMSWNMSWVWVVEGTLNVTRLNRAFQNLIKRHEILRTKFAFEKGEAVQIVEDSYDFKIEILEESEESIDKIVNRFLHPYDLSKKPLMRVGYIKRTGQSPLLIFDIHHIIADASSAQIIMKEVAAYYKGEELLPFNIQYKDYTIWQYQQVKSYYFKKQELYWMNKFSGTIPVLNLPTDYLRKQKRNNTGDTVVFEVTDLEIIRKLNQIVTQTQSSMFTVLVTVFSICMWKLSGQEYVTVGVPIAGRNHAELDSLIGMFINVIVLKSLPTGSKSFLEMLTETKEDFLDSCENSDYPFSELVQKLGIRPAEGRNPLFDVSFVMQNTGDSEVAIDEDVTLIPFPYHNMSARNDILMEAVEEKEKIRFILEYSTELFSSQTIDRFIKCYVSILTEVTKNYNIRLSAIQTISNEEKTSLLNDFMGELD